MSGHPDQPVSPDSYILLKNPFLPPWSVLGPTLDTGLTLITLVSSGVDEIIPFFNNPPLIGYLNFKISNLRTPLNLLLTPSPSRD